MTTTFPYTAWVLTPSFKPVAVTFVRFRYQCPSYGSLHETDAGKTYRTKNIHQTRAAAIVWGFTDLAEQQAAIDKKQQNLYKRRAALDKASKENTNGS